MGQITIRGLGVDLPDLDADAELDAVPALGEPAGLISGFEYTEARLPALELKDITLVTGKIGKVRAEETSVTGTQIRSVEFAGCELGSLRWSERSRGPGSVTASWSERGSRTSPWTM